MLAGVAMFLYLRKNIQSDFDLVSLKLQLSGERWQVGYLGSLEQDNDIAWRLNDI